MEALREKSYENQGHFENERKNAANLSRVSTDAQMLKQDRAPRIGILLLTVLRRGAHVLGVVFELAFGRVPLVRSKEPGVFEEVEQFENPLQRKPF